VGRSIRVREAFRGVRIILKKIPVLKKETGLKGLILVVR